MACRVLHLDPASPFHPAGGRVSPECVGGDGAGVVGLPSEPQAVSPRHPAPPLPPLPLKLCECRLVRLRQVGSWTLQPPTRGRDPGQFASWSRMAVVKGPSRNFLHRPVVGSCPLSHLQRCPPTESTAPAFSPTPGEGRIGRLRGHHGTAASLPPKAALRVLEVCVCVFLCTPPLPALLSDPRNGGQGRSSSWGFWNKMCLEESA